MLLNMWGGLKICSLYVVGFSKDMCSTPDHKTLNP